MYLINRKCCFKWFACLRYMDIDQVTGRNDNNRDRNQYNNIRVGCRDIYLYSN
jgi:hypothetical protein